MQPLRRQEGSSVFLLPKRKVRVSLGVGSQTNNPEKRGDEGKEVALQLDLEDEKKVVSYKITTEEKLN